MNIVFNSSYSYRLYFLFITPSNINTSPLPTKAEIIDHRFNKVRESG